VLSKVGVLVKNFDESTNDFSTSDFATVNQFKMKRKPLRNMNLAYGLCELFEIKNPAEPLVNS
jgi:hypothetical protein